MRRLWRNKYRIGISSYFIGYFRIDVVRVSLDLCLNNLRGRVIFIHDFIYGCDIIYHMLTLYNFNTRLMFNKIYHCFLFTGHFSHRSLTYSWFWRPHRFLFSMTQICHKLISSWFSFNCPLMQVNRWVIYLFIHH